MATKKKAPKKKAPAKKAAPKKQGAAMRQPPMHATVNHPELSDSQTEHSETFEIFKSFDRDGSGSIDKAELSRLLEALGQDVPEDELAVALEVIDSNHSGRISWDEFNAGGQRADQGGFGTTASAAPGTKVSSVPGSRST